MNLRAKIVGSQWLAWAFGASVATLLIARLVPQASRGILAGTWIALPAAALLLWRALRMVGGQPDRLLGARIAWTGAILVLSIAAPRLGLRWGTALVAPALAAGLFALVLWQGAELVRAISTSSQTTRRDARMGALVLTLFAVYLVIMLWSTSHRPPDGDEPYYLLMAHSLAFDFDADLTNNYEQGDSLEFMPRRIGPQIGDPIGPEGQKYSRHNMTVSILLALPYRAGGAQAVFMVMALLTALLGGLGLRLAETYWPGSPSATVFAAGLAGLAPPLLLYSSQVWIEVPAALCLAWGWLTLLALRRQGQQPRLVIQMVLACLLLPLIKLRFLLFAVPLTLLAVVGASKPHPRRLLQAALGIVVVLAAILAFNTWLFDSPLKHHSFRSLLTYLRSPVDYFKAPYGLLFDAAFGLLLTAPLWLLLLPGLRRTWTDGRRLFADAAILLTPYLVLLAPRSEWYGGWSPPFRYGIAFLPAMLVCLVPALGHWERRAPRLLITALAAATLCTTIVWLTLPGWTYNFGDGRAHLLDSLTRTFDADVARFFPSMVRPRFANWAWGLAAVPVLLLGGRRRRLASPSTAGWGVAIFLLALAALPLAATRLPLATIEFEDPYVEKHGGYVYPDRWMPGRVGFRGAWELESGDALALDLAPRGELLTLEIDCFTQAVGPEARLTLSASGTDLTTVALPTVGGWNTLTLGPVEWPAGAAEIGIRFQAGPKARLLLDRGRARWR